MKFTDTLLAHVGLNVRKLRFLLDIALRIDSRNATAIGAKLRYGSSHLRVLALVAVEDEQFLNTYRRFGGDSRAQLLQDIVCLHLRRSGSKSRHQGYFIEIGVGNGVDLSNTHLFERGLGWDGLLVEPNPHFHTSIRENRKCKLATEAAYDRCSDTVPFLSQSAREMSGLLSHTKKRRGHHHEEITVKKQFRYG